MNIVKSVFWNAEQNRLRTAYRIIIFIFFSILIGKGLQVLISSFTPEVEFSSSAPLWFFLIFASKKLFSGVFNVWIIGRIFDRRKFTEFGFHIDKKWWIDLVFGMGLGILLMSVIFLVEYSLGWIEISELFIMRDIDNLFILPISVCFVVFISVSISEEIVSRGYLLTNIAEGFHFKFIGPKGALLIGWFISSAVFGIAHMNNPNATFLSTFNIIIGGLLLGIGYVMTGRLAIPIGVHLTWNFFQANVFGFPVSGFTIPSEVVTIFKIEQMGPDLWTGGAFGPEAGLLGLFVILIGIIFTLGWLRYRNKIITFQLSLSSFQNKMYKRENGNSKITN